MTAHAHAEDAAREGVAPIIVDLSDAESYGQMVVLANAIAEHISAMPLEGIAKMARDAVRMAMPRLDVPEHAVHQLQRDRDVIAALEDCQRQLAKIRARYDR